MKDVHGVRKLRHITDAVFHLGMDSDLIDARTNRGHRLEIGWAHTLLNLTELKACQPPGILGERQ
jgi:hypothetical protein